MNNQIALGPSNPLLDALGPFPNSLAALAARMTPQVTVPPAEMRAEDVITRFQALGLLADAYIPTSRDVTAALKVSQMIIHGYRRRPPTAEYWREHQQQCEALANRDAPPAGRTSSPTFALLGTSGTGKSTGVDMMMNLYPSSIRHDQTKNPLLPGIQVPTLKVTCPVNKTPRAFILEFFVAIQNVTGIDYTSTLSRMNDDDLIVQMGRIARLHFLGLLVFDEVQQVAGGDGRLKRLLVRITNTIQIPILFVGTPNAQAELSDELATGRRMLGKPWLPFAADHDDWDDILVALWRYQVTRTPTVLDGPLRAKIHELTCGIPAVFKALYTLVQEHLIINSGCDGTETITPEVLEMVYRDEMDAIAPALQALRSGKGLDVFDDLLPTKNSGSKAWQNQDQLAHAIQDAFHSSAMKSAREQGRLFSQTKLAV